MRSYAFDEGSVMSRAVNGPMNGRRSSITRQKASESLEEDAAFGTQGTSGVYIIV